jgi:hypothetical protein
MGILAANEIIELGTFGISSTKHRLRPRRWCGNGLDHDVWHEGAQPLTITTALFSLARRATFQTATSRPGIYWLKYRMASLAAVTEEFLERVCMSISDQ